MKKIIVLAFLGLSACAGQSSVTGTPLWVGGGINDLQRSPCNCGGVESEERHKEREKLKKEAAKNGTVLNDIVRDEN